MKTEKIKTCGDCKNCRPVTYCGGDCDCKARKIQVSQDDEINRYGDNDSDCEYFE